MLLKKGIKVVIGEALSHTRIRGDSLRRLRKQDGDQQFHLQHVFKNHLRTAQVAWKSLPDNPGTASLKIEGRQHSEGNQLRGLSRPLSRKEARVHL